MHGPSGLLVVLLVSLLLGLRHASDPDHLAAVTTLIASEERRKRVRKATFMGFSWSLGHDTTLVLVGRYLPERVQQFAEVALGVRLLMRWRQGVFHAHEHAHDPDGTHRHLHSREEAASHSHETALRTPLSAYGVGLVHGIGGSGGLTLLLLSTISIKVEAVAALLIFAAGTAVSMALLSTAFGYVIATGPVMRNFERLAPALGALSAAFGFWYAAGALGLVTYPF